MPAKTVTARARQRGRKRENLLSPEAAKAAVLGYLGEGWTVEVSVEKANRTRKSYEYWRRTDPEFRAKADAIISTRKVKNVGRDENRDKARKMGFAAWRLEYLGQPTYPHQQQWIDLIEGREPTGLHPSQRYEPGKSTRIVINCPPNHGKTTVLTLDYVTYRIICNPGIKIAIVSKTADMAEDMVYGVKTRLTHPDYSRLIRDFAPEGGFEATATAWSNSRVRLAASDRDPADKDPTLQGLGIGSQIYGKRLDLVLVDDAVDGTNAQAWEPQMRWLHRDVSSRPGASGKVCVIGTRIAPADLYFQLRNTENFSSGKSPWTYLSQPAVLEETPDRADWVTLWPRSTQSWYTPDEDCWCGTDDCARGDHDGTFPRWDGMHIGAVKDDLDQNVWLQAYMQQEVGSNATFPAYAITEATNKGRRVGKDGGMISVPDDVYVIGACDPATSGYAGMLVYGLDRGERKRYLYDAWNIKHPSPQELKDRIKALTTEYGVNEWRIEKTGLLTMFTQDYELNQWLTARGVRLTAHYTGKNKFDVNFGVASMAALFGSWQDMEDGTHKLIADPLIDLPRHESEGMRALVHQLTIWTPELDPKKTPCDLVMALWFAECGARDRVKGSDERDYGRPARSGLVSRRENERKIVVDLNDFRRTVA